MINDYLISSKNNLKWKGWLFCQTSAIVLIQEKKFSKRLRKTVSKKHKNIKWINMGKLFQWVIQKYMKRIIWNVIKNIEERV